MKTIKTIVKYTIIITLGTITMGWFLINLDNQHQELENQYNKECIQNQRGL